MGTMTAQILVGHSHQNHGGISPSHYLFLSENSRPAWILVHENIFGDNGDFNRITWIPTVEYMFEDALLMIAIYILKDKEIISLAEKYFRNKEKDWVELYSDVERKDLEILYEKCRNIESRYKIVVTVLHGSTITRQVSTLENYKMDVEVCIPGFIREYSEWNGKTEVMGRLEL